MKADQVKYKLVPISELPEGIACGKRKLGNEPLTREEIDIVNKVIRLIEADESVFVFNAAGYTNTCYDAEKDKIYVAKNVFLEMTYASAHPRDLMSIAAFLAHFYYGHRLFRQEYLQDMLKGTLTIPSWAAEARASITAAKITPNLSRFEQSILVQDAEYFAEKQGLNIKTDDFMRVLFFGNEPSDTPVKGGFGEKIIFVDASRAETLVV